MYEYGSCIGQAVPDVIFGFTLLLLPVAALEIADEGSPKTSFSIYFCVRISVSLCISTAYRGFSSLL